jgi:hypothetical protein
MKKERKEIFKGIAFANLFAMLMVGLLKAILIWKEATPDNSGVLIYSNFVLIPMLMGIFCAYFIRNSGLKNSGYLLIALGNAFIGIACSAIFLGEGYICLLVVSPLIVAFVTAGMFIGKKIFSRKNNRMNVSIGLLFGITLLADGFSDHHHERCVTDSLLIHASPGVIWNYVVAYDPNPVKDEFWLFRIGMPCPVQSTVDGYHVGAGRKCIFSNGYTFDERMTVYRPGEELMFDVTHQPRDPEIMGHIDILRGQFILHDNHNGTTTLIGNSWYSLHVFPAWYYDLWAGKIVREVHLRVMQHIKTLSEKVNTKPGL